LQANRSREWQIWQDQLLLCQACVLCQTRTRIVCGNGNAKASIVLLGEAPGKQEDLSGIPFCGQAGKILDDFLAATGIQKETLYIGNTVKCRPVAVSKKGSGFVNRKPQKKEQQACKPWLAQELFLLDPQVIVTLGAVPLSHFIQKAPKMSQWHGRPFDYLPSYISEQNEKKKWLIFPLYHPAALIYDRKKVVDYQTDLYLLAQILREKELL